MGLTVLTDHHLRFITMASLFTAFSLSLVLSCLHLIFNLNLQQTIKITVPHTRERLATQIVSQAGVSADWFLE
jgi:hypothetical protein